MFNHAGTPYASIHLHVHCTYVIVLDCLTQVISLAINTSISFISEIENMLLDPSYNKYCYLIGQEQVSTSHLDHIAVTNTAI